MFIVCCSSCAVRHVLFVVCCSSCVVRRGLFVVSCSSCVVRRGLFVVGCSSWVVAAYCSSWVVAVSCCREWFVADREWFVVSGSSWECCFLSNSFFKTNNQKNNQKQPKQKIDDHAEKGVGKVPRATRSATGDRSCCARRCARRCACP